MMLLLGLVWRKQGPVKEKALCNCKLPSLGGAAPAVASAHLEEKSLCKGQAVADGRQSRGSTGGHARG